MHTKNRGLHIRKTLYSITILAVLLAAFGFWSLLSARAQGSIMKTPTSAIVSLSVNKTTFNTAEDITLQVTITNPAGHSIRMLKWFIPLEGFVEAPLFTIVRDGEPVTYLGIMVKRAAPTEQDYITLAAGESLKCDVNLSDYYDLSLSGDYTVTYDVTSIQLYAGKGIGQLNNDRLTSNILSVSIH